MDHIVVYGWGHNLYSKHTIRQAGELHTIQIIIVKSKTSIFFISSNPLNSGALQQIDTEAVEIGVNAPANRPARSNPLPMPGGRDVLPVLIESGSASK